MSHTLTLELSNQTFNVIQQQAKTEGVAPERLVAAFLEQRFGQMFKLLMPEVETQVARLRFEQHFGTLSLEKAIDLDNESIDADLVREYASTHEVD
jgi:hypothetical protein